ncbi:MAG: hypothetical protein JF606_16965 [Burkholderiales bacterium]|nr:hypothetical protein [Burkholderiales bacterium]
MRTLAQSAYLDSEFGVQQELPRVGSALENPYVFDATARELHDMARDGLVEIVDEHRRSTRSESLIDRLTFKRIR